VVKNLKNVSLVVQGKNINNVVESSIKQEKVEIEKY
jgi:hypothetical protein